MGFQGCPKGFQRISEAFQSVGFYKGFQERSAAFRSVPGVQGGSRTSSRSGPWNLSDVAGFTSGFQECPRGFMRFQKRPRMFQRVSGAFQRF